MEYTNNRMIMLGIAITIATLGIVTVLLRPGYSIITDTVPQDNVDHANQPLNTIVTMPLNRIDHSKQLLQKIGTLHTDDDLADITIQVEGERFPSHRVILSAQSPFFKKLLYDGRWEREITLTELSAPIFRDLLDYFYTGQLSLQSTVENYAAKIVHQSKRFELKLLHQAVVNEMCTSLLSDESWTEELGEFLDMEAGAVIQTDIFVAMSQDRVQRLLSRDSFWVEDEVDIFRAALRWSEGKTEDERKAVLGTVRLSLIQQADLLGTVWASGIIPEKDILHVMDKQRKKEIVDYRFRKVTTVPNENIATICRGASVIAGDNPTQCILDGDHHEYTIHEGFTSHRILAQDENQDGIKVQLDRVYSINTIQLHLQDKDNRLVSYYIEVSTQRDGPWTRVIDYTPYKCRGRQMLYFNTTPARYVKVLGTASTAGDTFALISLKCSFTENPLPMTQGLLEPVDNQALEAAGALLMQGSWEDNDGQSLLDGNNVEDYAGIYSDEDDGTTKIALPQPVWVGSLRFKLYAKCRYTIDVSVDDETWTQVVDNSQKYCVSWQGIKFAKRSVSFIKFSFPVKADNGLISYLGCPDNGIRN